MNSCVVSNFHVNIVSTSFEEESVSGVAPLSVPGGVVTTILSKAGINDGLGRRIARFYLKDTGSVPIWGVGFSGDDHS